MNTGVSWPMPRWVDAELGAAPVHDQDARMRLAIRLAERNVEENTGGPFGAVIFEPGRNRIVSAGLDLLTSVGSTAAHAELIAIARAHAIYGTPDLRAYGLELYASAAPCLMCLGAIVWSGVAKLLYGASEDAWRAQGWNDLPKPAMWTEELRQRGVDVVADLLRDEALHALGAFRTLPHPPPKSS